MACRSNLIGFVSHFFCMFFWLEPKEPKVQEKTNGSARFFGPRTETPIICKSFLLLKGKDEEFASCYVKHLEALIFLLLFL